MSNVSGSSSPAPQLPTRQEPTARILLADDHALMRAGLRRILEAEPDLRVVAEASDGQQAIDAAIAQPIDLAIMDVSMPRMTGLQAAREIRQRRPDTRILMLSMHDNERYFIEALRSGASGYVPKSVADRDLIAACRATLRGEPFLYPGALSVLVRNFLSADKSAATEPKRLLTAREEEVVKLIAEGLSAKQIADSLGISIKTVDRHRANILQKLDLHDRTALTRYAIRNGLVEA